MKSNRRYARLLVVILTLLILSPFPASAWSQPQKQFALASGDAWLEGWIYRKSHNITGESGAGADYQVMIIAEYGDGTDSDNTVYLGTYSQIDFGDVRFTDDDGETLLDYWIESFTLSDTATFWVQVQDTLSSDAIIYIYFGRSDVSTTSNGDAVFDIFSDFGRYMDTDTWTRYDDTDEYVMAEDIELVGTVDTIGKCEGFVYDGTYYYLSTFEYTVSESWLYQLDNSLEIIDSIEITDGPLIHTGGMCLYDGYLYVTMGENTDSQSYPSKIKRYHAETLTYVDIVVDSSDFGNDHWGGVVIVEELDRMYIGNWGIDELYVFQIDGTYVTTIETPPDVDIQDMVYIEEDGLIYGSKQEDPDYNIISVWRPDGVGNSLTKVGEVLTEDDRTNNGFSWYDGYFYSCIVGGDDLNYLRKLGGSDLYLTIDNYWIYHNTTIGPNVMIEARLRMTDNRKFNFGFAETPPSTDKVVQFHNSLGACYFYEGNEDDPCGFGFDAGLWTTLSLGWVEDHAKTYKNRASEHTTDDEDITGEALKPELTLWGSADAPILASWIFVRNWVFTEPVHTEWGTVEVQGIPAGAQWALDIGLIFLGLMMIPASVLYLVRGGKDHLSNDKVFFALVAFFMGCALFLGGIMP